MINCTDVLNAADIPIYDDKLSSANVRKNSNMIKCANMFNWPNLLN